MTSRWPAAIAAAAAIALLVLAALSTAWLTTGSGTGFSLRALVSCHEYGCDTTAIDALPRSIQVPSGFAAGGLVALIASWVAVGGLGLAMVLAIAGVRGRPGAALARLALLALVVALGGAVAYILRQPGGPGAPAFALGRGFFLFAGGNVVGMTAAQMLGKLHRADVPGVVRAMSLKGKTLFITGASRGIGLAIALRAAKDGANIAIAAKTNEPNPKLPGTIHTAAKEIEDAGGKALPLVVDIRFEEQVAEAVAKTVATFGGIDILVNNASAISLTGTTQTPMKRYDLMHSINTRGTYLCSQACVPHLKKAANPHVLNLSPPLNMETKWFAPHVAYTMAKFGMSMCVLGMAGEFKSDGIAFNALWPRTTIATAAIQNLLGGDAIMKGSRKPTIMADAAHVILNRPSRECTGNFFVDDEVLASVGKKDLTEYSVDPNVPLIPDFFV